MQLAWQFETYGLTFPVAEMEAGLLRRMTACLNVYKAISQRQMYIFDQKKTDADFKKNYPGLASICADIRELRKLNGEQKSNL